MIVQLIPNYSIKDNQIFFISLECALIAFAIQSTHCHGDIKFKYFTGARESHLHVKERIDSVKLRIEAVRVEVEEAHEEARRRDVRTLLQFEVIHVRHNQQNGTVRAYST